MKQIIKYAALLFALVLAASIIGGCLTAGVSVVRMIAEKTGEYTGNYKNLEDGNDLWYRNENGDVVFLGICFGSSEEVKSGTEEFAGAEIDSLELEVGSGELVVEVWEQDYVSVTYENIPEEYNIYAEDGTLVIDKDASVVFFWNGSFFEKQSIRVCVPASTVLDKVKVEKGSGSASLTGLKIKEFIMDTGSGSVMVSDVRAEKTAFDSGSGAFVAENSNLGEATMDSGSGFVTLKEIVANNLRLDTGSGRVDVAGVLTGNCVFDSGSGALNVVVYGEETQYDFRTDMGSGSFYLNGKKQSDHDNNVKHNGAEHLLIFDAGSGRVSLDFREMPGAMTDDAENYER